MLRLPRLKRRRGFGAAVIMVRDRPDVVDVQEARTMSESTVPAGVSQAFATFGREAPAHAAAWMQATQGLSAASALDEKTQALAYLAVLAAMR